MNHRIALAAAVAALSLSACNQKQETEVVGGPADPMANQIANAPPAAPLPSIAETKKYRCTGNEVLQVDWTELNGTPAGANIRVANASTPTTLTPAAEGAGYGSPDGTTLTGARTDDAVTLTVPGKGELSCKA